MGGKGIFVPREEAVLDPLWQLVRVGFRQVADFMLHGVDTSQEDRLLVFLSFPELGYQVRAMNTALRDEFVLPEAGGIVLQAGGVGVGYGEFVRADGAGFLGLFPASCKARG